MGKALTIWGLCFDIFGAVLIARSIATTKARVLATATFTVPGANRALYRALLEQKHDGTTGLAALLLGFIAQICGAIADASLPAPYWLHVLNSAIIVAIVTYHQIQLRRITKHSDAELRQIVDQVVAAQTRGRSGA